MRMLTATTRRIAAGKAFVAVLASLLVAASPAAAEEIGGTVVVDKPYSFQLDEYRVYLLGVDSVEAGQTCNIGRQSWDCWAAAQRQLEAILSEGAVVCDTVVGPDTEGRVIATCTVNGADVGERFVASGFGLAIPDETDRYVALQQAAREEGIGLWQGTFTPPAVWRSLPMRPKSGRPAF